MGYNFSGAGVSLNVAAVIQNKPPIKTVTFEVQSMTQRSATAAPLVIAMEQVFDAGGRFLQGPALLRYRLQRRRN